MPKVFFIEEVLKLDGILLLSLESKFYSIVMYHNNSGKVIEVNKGVNKGLL